MFDSILINISFINALDILPIIVYNKIVNKW